jgi:hypothetical protein
MPDHAFVCSNDPNFGSAFGGGCDEQADGITCGWPKFAHPEQSQPEQHESNSAPNPAVSDA